MIKRFFIGAIALVSQVNFGQSLPMNEVKLNILNALASASVEIGYERFLNENQSIDAELFINDRFSYFPKTDDKKFNAVSFKLGYNYYFDMEGLSGPYVNPFIKQRFGSYTDNGEKFSLNSFILGIGVGYMWNYNDKFIIAPYANVARSFSVETNHKFWLIEPNAGVRIGYRF